MFVWQIDGLPQDWGNSSALAMELPQSCAKPSKYYGLVRMRQDSNASVLEVLLGQTRPYDRHTNIVCITAIMCKKVLIS